MIQRHGGECAGRLDFSVNVNPLGTPENIIQAVVQSAPLWERYPDSQHRHLRQALSHLESIDASQIVCGNGAEDLIYRTISVLSPKNALLVSPCFSEYEKALAENGCEVTKLVLRQPQNFTMDLSYLHTLRPDVSLMILGSPNNPTGQSIPPDDMKCIVQACDRYHIYLFIDGCFLDFSRLGPRQYHALLEHHVILLRSFTKAYAIPGMRLGYALCGDAEIASRIHGTGPYWSVSLPAQAAGIAAVAETEYLRRSREMVFAQREYLADGLAALGFSVFPSDANFLLFQGENGLAEKLLSDGIVIRDCESFSLPGFYRIAVRKHSENTALLHALKKWKKSG